MTRALYADLSPGHAWAGRSSAVLEAATATQLTTRTVTTFLAAGLALLEENPRPIAFTVRGTNTAHAPATAVVTGTDADDAALVETVTLPQIASSVCTVGAFKTLTSVAYAAGDGTGATIAIGLGLIPGVRDVRGMVRVELLQDLLDHDRDGFIDRTALDVFAEMASNEIDSKVGEPNGNYPVPFDLPPPGKIADIAATLFVAYVGERHPTVVVVDHVSMLKRCERQLDELRKAYRGTAAAPPDPAYNTGGAVYPNPAVAANAPKFVGANKWGVF